MKIPVAGLLCCGIMLMQPNLNAGSTATSSETRRAFSKAERFELEGDFQQAAALLKEAANDPNLSEADRRLTGFELDRLERIRRDFPLSRAALLEELKTSVKDLNTAEFNQWVREGRFDARRIDGKTRFMVSSVSNLFFRYPELEQRRVPPKQVADLEMRRWQTVVSIKAAARSSGQPYVLPKHLEGTMNVTLKSGAVGAGELVRAWLPVPRAYPFQTDFAVVDSSPAILQLAAESSKIRSAYFEQKAEPEKALRFSITYRFTTHGVSFDLDPARVVQTQISEELKPFVQEAPHVVFSPEMKALARSIVSGETNVLIRAKRYYDWISANIQYSYATEYSTIRNISEYCRSKRYGDCGQEALLFITLCRMDGIPARWQSGWNVFPGAKSIHDWCEIFIDPYGWIPVDPYMGIYATQYVRTLSPEQKREIRDFYFGGLDQYRMIANQDHCQKLTPPKTGFRSDDVDFQRGELETGGENIYFDKYSYELQLKEIVP